MILPTHSQNILKGEVKETVNSNGDTLVIMHLEDARVILNDLLEYEVVDSLLAAYKEKDSLNTSKIEIQKDIIFKLVEKNDNQQTQINNFQQILGNKNEELGFKEDTIKEQKKEIRKQKLLKLVGFTSSVILPILTLIAML